MKSAGDTRGRGCGVEVTNKVGKKEEEKINRHSVNYCDAFFSLFSFSFFFFPFSQVGMTHRLPV